jgi:hypothetical protein
MARAGTEPRAVLLYPPLLDPTAGYHSLGYLKSFAAARGYRDVHVIDANVEAVGSLLEPDRIGRERDRLRGRRDELAGRAGRLDPDEAAEYGKLLKLDLVTPAGTETAVAVLRDPELFYDYPTYRAAVERIIAWLGLAGALGVPGQFTHAFQLRNVGWSRPAAPTCATGNCWPPWLARSSRTSSSGCCPGWPRCARTWSGSTSPSPARPRSGCGCCGCCGTGCPAAT